MKQYTKTELHKIVSIYNLGIDMNKLKSKKSELIKEMEKVGKKTFGKEFKGKFNVSKTELKKKKVNKKINDFIKKK